MSFKKFCPKCGIETNNFVNNVCVDCFLNGKNIFSIDKIKIFVCKHCSKLVFGSKWVDFSDELIAEEIGAQVKIIDEIEEPKVFVELTKKPALNYDVSIKVSGFILNQLVESEKKTKFQLKETTCDSCMKLNSSYREAIIQLRAKNVSDAQAMLEFSKNFLANEKTKNSLSGTSKIVSTKNGFDLWVGSKKAASKVIKELSIIYKVRPILSKKLVGEDENGERRYRHTFCIKLE